MLSLRSLVIGRRHVMRSLSTATTATTTTPVKAAYELDDAPLFSLRTRIIFFSLVGSAAIASAASFWLTSDQENAYWAFEQCPQLMQTVGPRLGVPIDPVTLHIDKNVLGPRDIRDLVGEDRIAVELVFKSGDRRVVEALPMEHISSNSGHDQLDRVRVVN